MNKDYAIEVENLTICYDNQPALQDINVKIPQGIMLGILGPNGAGKSSFIKSILGLIKPTNGNISIMGKRRQKKQKILNYIPQRENVDWDFPINVLEVAKMGRYGYLKLFQRPQKSDEQIAMQALAMVGMEEFAYTQIGKLSEGQQQRVFIARALAQNGDIYLMDEPFAGVDNKTEKSLVTMFKELKNKGKTIIVIHHDLQTVEEYFDWILLMNLKKIAFGEVKKVFTQENLYKTFTLHPKELF